MNRAPLSRAIVAATPSPYPASFDDSTLQFTLALFSLMSISIVGWMLMCWMGGQIWAGRRDAFPAEPLFAVRGLIFTAALTAFMRAGPEAAMMITWRENIVVAGRILAAKRWFDAASFVPAMTWMGTAFVFYPQICMGLVRIAREDGLRPFIPVIPRDRARRFCKTLALIFAISALIAIGKRW